MKRNPLALQALPRETENKLEEFFQQISETIRSLQKGRLETQQFEQSLEEILSSGEAQSVRDTYKRIKDSEGLLHSFVETHLLYPIRNGAFGYGRNEKILRFYTLTARVGGEKRSITTRLKQEELRRYREADEQLARDIALRAFGGVEQHPVVLLSYLQYMPEQYHMLLKKREEAKRKFKEKKNFPGRTAQHRKAAEKVREAEKKLKEFEQQHSVLWIGTRVKGAESLAYKITDKLVGLDEIVRANKILDDEFPTAIKDVLGVKIIVNNEDGENKVVQHLYGLCDIYGNIEFLNQKPKDYWRNAKIVDGRLAFQGWKNVIFYNDAPIEIQIQTPEMYEKSEADHAYSYKERQMQRRWVAVKKGIPYVLVLRTVSKLLNLPLDEEEAGYWLEKPPWPKRVEKKLCETLIRS